MKLLTSLSLVALSFGVSTAASQEPTEPRDLGPVLEAVLAEFDVPGIGAAIVNSDGMVALGVAGVRQRGSESKILVDDRFHIGSCTKAMTATLLALHVQEEALHWSTTIAEALPAFVETMDEGWRDVTLQQVLSHTAGMPNNLRDYGDLGSVYRTRDKPMLEVRRKFVEGILQRPPLAEPETRFAYSNYGYVALGAILERLEEKPWEELMRTQLFEPLGMTSAGFGAPDAPYFVEKADEVDTGEPPQPRGHFDDGRIAKAFDNVPAIGPAGTVHCTLEDWAKFVRLHLRGAQGEKDLLLQPATFAALHQGDPASAHLRDWRRSVYGGGWVITERDWTKGKAIMHDGSNTAWYAFVWIAPALDFAVVVSCNRGGSLGRKAAAAAVDRLVGEL